MKTLQVLANGARAELTPAFLDGSAGADVQRYVRPFGRKIALEPLDRLLEEAMTRFDGHREASDAWLAPRVHASVRLTRREAAEPGIWSYLAVVEFPAYVRWRWGNSEKPAVPARFAGAETTQAFARLWWGAELFRNGADYRPVEKAFELQDIPNTWLRLDAIHNRHAALAALRTIDRLESGPLPDGSPVKKTKKINMLSTAVNVALTTTVLDAISPEPEVDPGAVRDWMAEPVDETLMLNDLPAGPPEEQLTDEELASTEELIGRIADSAGLLEPGGSGDEAADTETEADGPAAPEPNNGVEAPVAS